MIVAISDSNDNCDSVSLVIVQQRLISNLGHKIRVWIFVSYYILGLRSELLVARALVNTVSEFAGRANL